MSHTFLSVPFAAIPSAPQAVISSVNETSLMLEWSPPRDSGGREDLVYNIICKSCGAGRGACTRCGDNVQFTPRQLGLTEPRIYISDLLAHTQYTFEIQAVNGVTDQSPFSPQFASVNITTNQAGKAQSPGVPGWAGLGWTAPLAVLAEPLWAGRGQEVGSDVACSVMLVATKVPGNSWVNPKPWV